MESAAARALALGKATVSEAVARLATPLIHRTSRRLALTDAARLLADGEVAAEALSDCAASPRGQVRVAAPMPFGIAYPGPVLAGLLAAYPEVSIDLRLGDARTDLIRDGIDLALRIGVLEDGSSKARRLFAVRAPLVAAPAWIAAHGRPAHPRDLIGRPASHIARPGRRSFAQAHAGEVAVDGRLRLDDGDVAMAPLPAGIGMARQPDFMVWAALRDGRPAELLPDRAGPAAALHLGQPSGGVRRGRRCRRRRLRARPG